MAGSSNFVAIDFETADYHADSACAIGLVRVENGEVVQRVSRLIRPPRKWFQFTYIHGITWNDVKDEPTFGEVWPTLEPVIDGANYLVAHNASFDRGVLETCCRKAKILPPALPFVCTMLLARRTLRIYPTKLPDVCRRLQIALKHHDALSDAEAAARIALAVAAVSV